MAKQYKYIVLTLLSFTYFTGSAQSTAGITDQPDTSYTIYSAFISTKKNYPDIKVAEEFYSASVKEKRNITYCKYEKRKLQLDVFYPSNKTKQKRIAIMIIHGGGWRTGNRTQHYPLAQRLANMGYVCFTPEYRLSTEALYPAAVYDLKAALRWIHANAKKYNIGTAKIAVLGFSAGGQLAALLATTNNRTSFEGTECNLRYSSRVNALVDMDGILSFLHPESGEGDDSKKTSAATNWFGYSKTENPKLWEAASALSHVNKHTPPTLFINSSVARMHAGRADFIKVLNKYNIYSEIKTFENAPHSFPFFHPWFEPTLTYVDEFLKKVFATNHNR
ncbi:MAG TPA: alpha/beta hydrolase [Chitinophagaceae bacterium]|nr:alpha/beta hydrolase [Chitinophagaceae bacterium]